MQLERVFRTFGFSVNAAEIVTLILVLFAVTVIFWLLIGRFRLHSFLANIYISFALAQALPKDIVSNNSTYIIVVFLLLLGFLTWMGKYTFDIHLSGSALVYWQMFVMSFLEVGLVVSILAQIMGDKLLLKYVSKESLIYFTSPWAKFIWLAAPLAFLIYINKKGR